MQKVISTILYSFFLALLFSCSQNKKTESQTVPDSSNNIGYVESLSNELEEIIDIKLKPEILATGFTWAEGPVWVPELSGLLYSDVPENKIYLWTDQTGNREFITPSGNTGYSKSSLTEGSNGLILDPLGNLILAQHGDRRVAKLVSPFGEEPVVYETIVDSFNGKKFNSPNDLILDSQGNLYFTDPPYGLKDRDLDSLKELNFNGVFRLSSSGDLILLDSTLSKPNGLALSPDERTLYVANSDPEMAVWKSYELDNNRVVNTKLFFDATDKVAELNGLPDGLKVNGDGILFATGPGGVLIFKPDGTLLGTIMTELATANCALGPDEKVLYMTTHKHLTRITLR